MLSFKSASRHRPSVWAFALATLVSSLCACGASTRYRPQHDDHVYLVLNDGVPSYYLNGDVKPVQSGDSIKLLGCSTRARELADEADDKATAARTITTVGAFFGLVGALLFTPIAAVSQDRANALTVDAMNVYNETQLCSTRPWEPVAAGQAQGVVR